MPDASASVLPRSRSRIISLRGGKALNTPLNSSCLLAPGSFSIQTPSSLLTAPACFVAAFSELSQCTLHFDRRRLPPSFGLNSLTLVFFFTVSLSESLLCFLCPFSTSKLSIETVKAWAFSASKSPGCIGSTSVTSRPCRCSLNHLPILRNIGNKLKFWLLLTHGTSVSCPLMTWKFSLLLRHEWRARDVSTQFHPVQLRREYYVASGSSESQSNTNQLNSQPSLRELTCHYIREDRQVCLEATENQLLTSYGTLIEFHFLRNLTVRSPQSALPWLVPFVDPGRHGHLTASLLPQIDSHCRSILPKPWK